MRDVSIVEPSGKVEFDVITAHVFEQPSALPEEDRSQMDLHLVDLPGSEKRWGRACPMDHDRRVNCRTVPEIVGL